MTCKLDTEALSFCSVVQGGVTLATTIAGAIAAPFALTAVTVGAVALAAGLFAAPAAIYGLAMTGLFAYSEDLREWSNKHNIAFAVGSAVVFALLSAAAITAGVMLGVLTTSLMVVFIVAAVIGTAVQLVPVLKD